MRKALRCGFGAGVVLLVAIELAVVLRLADATGRGIGVRVSVRAARRL